MNKQILNKYEAWLVHQEYSQSTIEKYTHALRRFFTETGAGQAPGREAVAAWRDSLSRKGYTPATVNAMLAAVNDYQESIDNPAGKAKPLKRQRKIFADPGRELSRAEYFRLLNAARETGNKRTQLLLETICSTGIRVSELQYITLEAVRPAQSEHTLQRQMQRNSVAGRTLPPSDALVSAQAHPCGGGFPFPRGKAAQPRNSLEIVKGPVRTGQCGMEEGSFPITCGTCLPRTFYKIEKNLSKLADLLGHSSIETTRIYIMESGAEHERLLNQMHLLL